MSLSDKWFCESILKDGHLCHICSHRRESRSLQGFPLHCSGIGEPEENRTGQVSQPPGAFHLELQRLSVDHIPHVHHHPETFLGTVPNVVAFACLQSAGRLLGGQATGHVELKEARYLKRRHGLGLRWKSKSGRWSGRNAHST